MKDEGWLSPLLNILTWPPRRLWCLLWGHDTYQLEGYVLGLNKPPSDRIKCFRCKREEGIE